MIAEKADLDLCIFVREFHAKTFDGKFSQKMRPYIMLYNQILFPRYRRKALLCLGGGRTLANAAPPRSPDRFRGLRSFTLHRLTKTRP
jgi:hypothetical protein